MTDTPQRDPAISDFLLEAYSRAPEAVRDFVSSGRFDAFLEKLQAQTNLHVDVFGKVSNEILMMLLGITEPVDFPTNLKNEAGVPDELVPAIIDATNEGIFIPIRTQMRGESSPGAPTALGGITEPAYQQAPSPLETFHAAPTPVPTPSPAPEAPIVPPQPAPSPLETFHATATAPTPTPVPVPPHPVPVPEVVVAPIQPQPSPLETFHAAPPIPQPAPVISAPIPASVPQAPVAPVPMRTMAQDLATAENPSAPVPPPQTMPVPPAPPAPATAPAPAQNVPSMQEVHDDLKKYGIDPYREPFA